LFGARGGALIAGKAGYAIGCVLAATVLLVSGYAFHVERQLGDVSSSRVDAGGPQVGDMNILLMGLESRTYGNGEPLPKTLEDAMHIGSIGGDTTGVVGNATAQSETVRSATQVFYGAGASANGAKIAKYFGVTAAAAPALPSGHVEVLLGPATTGIPAGLASSASGSGPGGSTPTPSASPSATSAANNGQAGGAVTVKATAPFGIPCVD
jgi:hypothetical protein